MTEPLLNTSAVTGKKLTLSLTYAFDKYKVVSVTNSTLFKPGAYLDEAEVHKVCENLAWDVTMVDPDIPGQIFNFIRGLVPQL